MPAERVLLMEKYPAQSDISWLSPLNRSSGWDYWIASGGYCGTYLIIQVRDVKVTGELARGQLPVEYIPLRLVKMLVRGLSVWLGV